MDFPWEAEIGAGFAFAHGRGVVVSRGAKLGRNVTLFHGVTIGRKDDIFEGKQRVTRYPVIEDQVWIGPHAIILGGVRVGKGARVAAAAVVTQNVPPRSIVAGNPARLLKEDAPPDVVNPVAFD